MRIMVHWSPDRHTCLWQPPAISFVQSPVCCGCSRSIFVKIYGPTTEYLTYGLLWARRILQSLSVTFPLRDSAIFQCDGLGLDMLVPLSLPIAGRPLQPLVFRVPVVSSSGISIRSI